MTDSTHAARWPAADPRMPPAVVALLLVQVAIVVGWCVTASGPLLLVWAGLGGDAFGGLFFVLALPSLIAIAVSVFGVIGIYRETAPGWFAVIVQCIAVVLSMAIGDVSLVSGTFTAIVVVPFLILSIVLPRLRESRPWFEHLCFADPPPPLGLSVFALTTLAIPFWSVSAVCLFLHHLGTAVSQWARGGGVDLSGLLIAMMLPVGAVANVVVLLAIARRWRMPRTVVLVGSVLAAIGLGILVPPLWWAAALALVPSALLWVPAIAREFAAPGPDTTSEITPRHPG